MIYKFKEVNVNIFSRGRFLRNFQTLLVEMTKNNGYNFLNDNGNQKIKQRKKENQCEIE